MTDRRPSAGLWAAAFLLSLPLFYVASFGPACGLVHRDVLPDIGTARVYRPLVRAATSDFPLVAVPVRWWAELFAPGQIITTTNVSVVDMLDVDLDIHDIAASGRPHPFAR